jgi:hypothetical protein
MKHCEPYFLNHKNIDQFIKKNATERTPKGSKAPTFIASAHLVCSNSSGASKVTVQLPTEVDVLFWNFFIAWKGETEYEHLKLFHKIDFSEKQLKIQFLEKINAQRKQLKNPAETELNLMDKKINFKTVVLLASMEKINIVVSFQKSFYLAVNDSSKPYYHFHNDTVEEITTEEIDQLKQTKIQRVAIDKTIGSISNYKLADLKEIFSKISDCTVRKTKQQLYDEIKQY